MSPRSDRSLRASKGETASNCGPVRTRPCHFSRKRSAMKVKLVMFKQDGQRRDFELKRDTATLGRNTDCDFQIPLAIISRRHSQLFVKGNQLFVRDLGSSNGTFVNNKRIQESELHAGDTLVIGPVIF